MAWESPRLVGAGGHVMSAELTDWISRLGGISGDSRKDLMRCALRCGWELHDFARLAAGDAEMQRLLLSILRPFEVAVVMRAWRVDFGSPARAASAAPSPSAGALAPGAFRNPQGRYEAEAGRGPGDAADLYPYSPCGAAPADPGHQELRSFQDGPGADAGARQPDPPPPPRPPPADPPERRRMPAAPGAPPAGPGDAAQGGPWRSPEATLDGACAIAAASDGSSVYVAGDGGLERFELPSLQRSAASPYPGKADAPGYVEVAAGEGYVVCADVACTLYEHDPTTCALRNSRSYQPSVTENSQRVVGGQLRRFSGPVVGLEGGPGGAPRLAAGRSAVFLAGRDGVVTAYAPGSLHILARTKLSEGPQCLGVRFVYLAPSQRLYCGVLSILHVLLAPTLQGVAKLRGGPRVPVFGNVCSAAESLDGCLAFSADVGGPSVHIWDTASWQWLARVELAEVGGPARHLVVIPGDRLLCAATELGRFLAFRTDRVPPLCIEEGAGGGPLAAIPGCSQYVAVLLQGASLRGLADYVVLRPLDDPPVR